MLASLPLTTILLHHNDAALLCCSSWLIYHVAFEKSQVCLRVSLLISKSTASRTIDFLCQTSAPPLSLMDVWTNSNKAEPQPPKSKESFETDCMTTQAHGSYHDQALPDDLNALSLTSLGTIRRAAVIACHYAPQNKSLRQSSFDRLTSSLAL